MSRKWEEVANAASERQSCMTHENCSSWTLIAPILMSKILVTLIELNNKVVSLLPECWACNSSANYQSYSCIHSCSTVTVNAE